MLDRGVQHDNIIGNLIAAEGSQISLHNSIQKRLIIRSTLRSAVAMQMDYYGPTQVAGHLIVCRSQSLNSSPWPRTVCAVPCEIR